MSNYVGDPRGDDKRRISDMYRSITSTYIQIPVVHQRPSRVWMTFKQAIFTLIYRGGEPGQYETDYEHGLELAIQNGSVEAVAWCPDQFDKDFDKEKKRLSDCFPTRVFLKVGKHRGAVNEYQEQVNKFLRPRLAAARVEATLQREESDTPSGPWNPGTGTPANASGGSDVPF